MSDKKTKMLLSGNEAIARGVLEAGVDVAAAYPGTPSTEIMENIALFGKETGMHAEWSINEKIAFEVALGAAWSGLRSFTVAKHVGLNVAADPFFTAALFGGMKGGFVMCIADDHCKPLMTAWRQKNVCSCGTRNLYGTLNATRSSRYGKIRL